MTTIIDRRLNPKDKTIKNRQRFIQRSRYEIKKVVKDAINSDNIADIENGKVKIRVKGTREPQFEIDPKSGNKKYILPNNDRYVAGDREDKPSGSSSSSNQGGLGQGEDDFDFVLNQDEFLDFMFEDLELPNLVKKQIKDITKYKLKRAGYVNSGNPTQLDIIKSLTKSIGRRIGLGRPKNKEIQNLEQELDLAKQSNNEEEIKRLELLIEGLKRRQVKVPWLDPVDLRYRNFVPSPQPITQAVMFCILDVSGSMGQREKDLAKRFFVLLYTFLKRKYEKVNIVFIRHHEQASEVDESEFFASRESGGTVVSSGLKLTKKIIDERYNVNDWNIYIAQASDGDNYHSDNNETAEVMNELLPLAQYFAYIEILREHADIDSTMTEIWNTYSPLAKENDKLQIKRITEVSDIWKVFKELFSKERASNG
mgnify:CR=1 FL=1